MAAAIFLSPSFSSPGHGFSIRRGRLSFAFSLRALNGDDSSSSEERARVSLKDLDDQLSSPAPPRPAREIKIEDEPKIPPSKGSLPVLSDGLLLYIAGGLFLLTIVNNLLFYFFVDRPNRDAQISKEAKKSDSVSPSGAEKNMVAPQPQAGSEM